MLATFVLTTLLLSLAIVRATPIDGLRFTGPATIGDEQTSAFDGSVAFANAYISQPADDDSPDVRYVAEVVDITINGTHYVYVPDQGLIADNTGPPDRVPLEPRAEGEPRVKGKWGAGFGGGGPSSVLSGLINAMGELDRDKRGDVAFDMIEGLLKTDPGANVFVYHQFQGNIWWWVGDEDHYEFQYSLKRKDLPTSREYYKLVAFYSDGWLRNDGDGGPHRWAWAGRWSRDGQTVNFQG